MRRAATFKAEILEALGSDTPELRTEAVRAAGAMGLEEIAEAAQDAYDEMVVWSKVDGLDDNELEEDLF